MCIFPVVLPRADFIVGIKMNAKERKFDIDRGIVGDEMEMYLRDEISVICLCSLSNLPSTKNILIILVYLSLYRFSI